MEPTTAKSDAKPAINDTSLLACLPEPVLELVLAAAGPRARMRSARCSRGVQDAALLPDKYWREAYTQRWWHARAALVPEKSAVAFAARVKGERACCDLLVALAESGNQLTWRQKNDCVERAGDDACELLARISAATNVYSEPHTPFGRARRSGLRPPPAPGSTAAWVAVVSPRAAQTLRACGQAGVVGNHARDLLTHAQTARLRNRWRPAPSLEEASARVAFCAYIKTSRRLSWRCRLTRRTVDLRTGRLRFSGLLRRRRRRSRARGAGGARSLRGVGRRPARAHKGDGGRALRRVRI